MTGQQPEEPAQPPGPAQPAQARPAGARPAGGRPAGGRPAGTRPRDPARGLRAITAAHLVLEALVVLLALPATAQLGGGLSGGKLGVLLALTVALVLTAGLLRRPAAYTVGSALQVAILLSGLLVWPMFLLGLAFGAIWVYLLRLRAELAAESRPDRPAG